ncbi:MAG: low molecular weight phosphotyrosine protein phosphatase [Paludibacteraceae bacterium]|nr:low molecular weight phosphotyrosine protein phosphatase [Paludibacteraceae bacterium]
MTKILFICHGNICRSPMAEFMLRHFVAQAGRTAEFEIASAAVSAEEIGNALYPPAKRKLREKGIPFTSHAARQVIRADYDYYDHIICMDRSNLRLLRYRIGDDDQGKVSLMMSWINDQMVNARDVADPWYTGDFEATYSDLLQGCQAILEQL